jgi:hypothetical protein
VLRGVAVDGRVRLHVHVAVAHRRRVRSDVVRPRVERVAAGQLEARVMPVARQHAVLDAPFCQREPHVRAAVVDRTHLALVVEQGDRRAARREQFPARVLEVVERDRANESLVLCCHSSWYASHLKERSLKSISGTDHRRHDTGRPAAVESAGRPLGHGT